MTEALLGLAVGIAAGLIMARSGLCFNRALRRAVFEHRPALLRAFALAVATQLVLLPVLVLAGVGTLVRSAAAGGPALLPASQVAGGLVFGAGMALAGGCITGMLWKAGGGALALGIALVGFAAGELIIRGPGRSVVGALDDAARPDLHALPQALEIGYEPLAALIGVAALTVLLARRRDAVAGGLALGVVAAATWLAADAAGYGYGLGFVGAADGTRSAINSGSAAPFSLWLAAGVLVGGLVAGRPRLRRPDAARSARAAVGGVMMGAGGTVAHGCNIGHGLTGLPLLSFGSLLATACMVAGALITWRLVLSPWPRLRGQERPMSLGSA